MCSPSHVDSIGFVDDSGLILRIQQEDKFGPVQGESDGFAWALEGAPHAAPHNWVGYTMSDGSNSPDDPFFLHHCNVDRSWALWQDIYHGDSTSPDAYSDPQHFSGDLDVPMPFGGSTDAPDDSWFQLDGPFLRQDKF